MTDRIRHASCACGKLRAVTCGEPRRMHLCSCRDCRRRTGTAFNWATYWRAEQVEITGESRSYDRDSQHGRRLENHFCPVCGVALWWRADFAPDEIAIAGGTFEEDDLPEPTIAYWTEGRPAWALHLADIPAKERQ